MVTKTINIGKMSIDLNMQWDQLIDKSKWNWLEFDLLKLYVEKEYIHGMFEVEVYVLGFGLRFYWTWNDEMMAKKYKEYKDIIEKDEWVKL